MSSDGLRLLWKSNAPHVGSGYGVQANSLLPRLMQHPDIDDIAIFGYYGVQGGATMLPVGRGIPGVRTRMMQHYPVVADIWGNDVVWDHARQFDAHAVITLLDAWVLRDDYGHGGFLWLPYAPSDHEPLPPPVLDKLRKAFHPISYSQHASRQFAEAGLDYTYIPHGVETSIYRPLSRKAKQRARRWLGLSDDAFVVGCVAANKGWPSRKGFPELFEAFAVFSERHPDAHLYIHTLIKDPLAAGPDLTSMSRLYGIAERTRFTHPYIVNMGFSFEEMNKVYNAFDVFCLPSMGEGFGIPIVEAQAAGVPVIVTDWTACSELCGAGWRVPIGKKWPTPLDSFQAFADVPALVDAMEESYQLRQDAERYEAMSQQAVEFAQGYNWPHLMETCWNPFVSWLWETLRPKTFQMPQIEIVHSDTLVPVEVLS